MEIRTLKPNPQGFLNTYFSITILFIALLSGMMVSCKPPHQNWIPVTPVKIDVVEKALVADVLLLEGNVEAERVVDVPPYRSGIVKDIFVEVNDEVKVGQTLFTVDQSTITGGRYEPTTIYSPINGIVSDVNVRRGMTVGASTPLGTVLQQEIMKIICDVPAEKVFTLINRYNEVHKTGHRLLCWITVPAHKDPVVGWVEKVYPADDKSTRTARVEVRYENTEKILRHNMFAQVELFMGEHESILIPKDAVVPEKILRYLMVYKPLEIDSDITKKENTTYLGRVNKQIVQVNENQSIIRIKAKDLNVSQGDSIIKTFILSDFVELLKGVQASELILVEGQKWANNNELVKVFEPDYKVVQIMEQFPERESLKIDDLRVQGQ